MKYNRFEDLPVWNHAIEFAVTVFAVTASREFKTHRSIRDQLERAALSISNNIAEGFERGTTPEVLTFLYIARGSAGECRSVLSLLERLPDFGNFKFEISNLKLRAEEISRQLRGWCNSLQNSEIRGQSYLTDKSRRQDAAKREREEFLKELKAIQMENILKQPR